MSSLYLAFFNLFIFLFFCRVNSRAGCQSSCHCCLVGLLTLNERWEDPLLLISRGKVVVHEWTVVE